MPAWPAARVSWSLSEGSAKPGQAARSPDRGELVPPAGHELVGVALVRGVPDQPVFGAVEGAVQGERQLDDAEVGSEVPAGLRDRLDDHVAAALRDLG